MSSCWDVLSDTTRSYGHLPEEKLEEWAIEQTEKSRLFREGRLEGTSESADGRRRKAEMLQKLRSAFRDRANEHQIMLYDLRYHSLFEGRLEDPGLMDNFEYFDVPSSDYMIMFYLSTWTGRMADSMIFLHNYGWNLKGEFGPIPETDVWYQMSSFEGMNISERKKVQILRDAILDTQAATLFSRPAIFSFGGGNEPLKLYQPEPFDWCIFDDGRTCDAEELKKYLEKHSMTQREREGWRDCDIEYYHENLFSAMAHPQLMEKFDLGYMFGVSMYLGAELLAKALNVAFKMLKTDGKMMFDVLFWTDSMRRVVETQGWPKGKKEMYVFDSIDDATKSVCRIVEGTNSMLDMDEYFDIEAVQPILVEPWGVTSMVFTVTKCGA